MCWAAIPLVLGTALSTYSAYQSGQSEKQAQQYNAAVNRATAHDIENSGAISAAEQRAETRRMTSKLKTAQAASNVDTTTGSAMDTTLDVQSLGELNALRILNNAQRTAVGGMNSANINDANAKNANRASWTGAGTSLLSGATNLLSMNGKKTNTTTATT